MKVLSFDIETAPNIAYSWGKYDQTIPAFVREWHMLSFAYKWLGKKVQSYSLPDFALYKRDRNNDRALVKKLHSLLEEADVVVAHNGDDFDIKRANARFLVHKLNPIHPRSVDTLKVLRRNFSFNSNKLDDVCQQLGLGRKVKHEGIGLWIKCLDGDMGAWKRMVRYNKQDVVILEKLYLYLLPWIANHPNRNVYDGTISNCPRCGHDELRKAGFKYTKTQAYQSYRCLKCGARPAGTRVINKSSILVA